MAEAGERQPSIATAEPEPTVITDGEAQTYGRYQLRFEIATGGMASVYLASVSGAAGFEKLVALKRIHPHLAKRSQFVEMFLDEARIAARIQHPNVCSVNDFGETDGTYYLAMDYLVGEPVSRLIRALRSNPELRDLPLFPAIAARIVADACEGLHAAHEVKDDLGKPLNIVHRDVSPHNVFVTYDGAVRIVDFGVASAENRLHETTAGTVKGKYAYMAPEQVRAAPPDRRMDIWALGVVLFETLTGTRLFRRDTEAETISAVQSDPIPKPSSLAQQVPPALDVIVMRALARDPEGRYGTAREMGRELLRFLGSQPEPVGLADVSDFMEHAFPGGRERKMQLVAIARQSAQVVPKMIDDSGSSASVGPAVSAVKRRSRPPPGTALTPRVRAVAALTLVLAGALVGVIAMRAMSNRDEGTETETQPGTEAASGSETETQTASGSETETETETETGTASGSETETETETASGSETETETETDTETETEAASGSETETETETASTAGTQRPAMRPGPEARGEGQINVVTPGGWAVVRFRGRRIGQTPGQFTLPAGPQVIELQPFGEGRTRRVRINVTRGTTRRVAVPISG